MEFAKILAVVATTSLRFIVKQKISAQNMK